MSIMIVTSVLENQVFKNTVQQIEMDIVNIRVADCSVVVAHTCINAQKVKIM